MHANMLGLRKEMVPDMLVSRVRTRAAQVLEVHGVLCHKVRWAQARLWEKKLVPKIMF